MARPETSAQQFPEPALRDTDYGESPAAHASRWRGLSSPWLQGVLAFAVYAAVWLPTIVRPLVIHPGRAQLLQANPDPNFYVWSLRWWPYALEHGLNPLYTNLVAAPAGHSLAWVTTVPPLALLAAPLTLTAGPVVAFNLLIALSLPLSAWAAFATCRRLTGQFLPALAGGVVYGFSAYEVRHLAAGQPNLCFALLPPLLAYLVLVWRDGAIRSWVLVILAGLILAAQFYLFLETFADLTVILVLSVLLGLAVAGRAGRREVLRLAGVLGIGYLVALALAAPYLAATLSTASPKAPPFGSMDLASLWLPEAGRDIGLGWLGRAETGPVSAGCSVGIPLLAVVVVLAATRWRSRLTWFLVSLLIVIVVAALGPVLYIAGRPVAVLPWHGIFSLPFVHNAYPARLMLFAFLVLAVATALLLAGVTRQAEHWWTHRSTAGIWSAAGRWSLGALVVAFAGLNASASLALAPQTTVPAFVSQGDYHHLLARGEIVMVVSSVRNAGMLWQAESGDYWRLAGGFINEGFDHRSDLPVQAQNLAHATPRRVDQFEALVRADHIGAILIDARNAPGFAPIFGILGLTGHQTGGVIVYTTDGCRTCREVTSAEIQAATFPS
jgi:hypothetical protein